MAGYGRGSEGVWRAPGTVAMLMAGARIKARARSVERNGVLARSAGHASTWPCTLWRHWAAWARSGLGHVVLSSTKGGYQRFQGSKGEQRDMVGCKCQRHSACPHTPPANFSLNGISGFSRILSGIRGQIREVHDFQRLTAFFVSLEGKEKIPYPFAIPSLGSSPSSSAPSLAASSSAYPSRRPDHLLCVSSAPPPTTSSASTCPRSSSSSAADGSGGDYLPRLLHCDRGRSSTSRAAQRREQVRARRMREKEVRRNKQEERMHAKAREQQEVGGGCNKDERATR
ncbi:uncharacterized protein LOC124673611 [Lolium rigidum]|uniref:uncharacterized protein LOC124673611 n=1 Tax=Lolium rigidum TaxID=89674 RepID=UPI001F5E1F72|nr:uncharacterized protein LOC124673611 [Lolium rigidum]